MLLYLVSNDDRLTMPFLLFRAYSTITIKRSFCTAHCSSYWKYLHA